MTTPLTLSIRRDGDGTPVLTAAGEIDMSNADDFHAALDEATTGGTCVIVDLTAVGHLDNAGLTALFAHAPRLRLIVPALLYPLLAVSGLSDLATVDVV